MSKHHVTHIIRKRDNLIYLDYGLKYYGIFQQIIL